jgi:hypothetical protein
VKTASPFSKKEQELVDRALARHEEYPPLSPDQAKVIGRVFGALAEAKQAA